MQKKFTSFTGAAGRALVGLLRVLDRFFKPLAARLSQTVQRSDLPRRAASRLRALASRPRALASRLSQRLRLGEWTSRIAGAFSAVARRTPQETLRGISSRIVDLSVTFASMVVVVFKRLRHNQGLSICAVLGIVAVLGIAVCVPIFSYAVSSEVLHDQLVEKATTTHRALFSVHMYYQDKSSKGPGLTMDQSSAVTRFLQNNASRLVGPRLVKVIDQVESTQIMFNPESVNVPLTPGSAYLNMSFFSQDDLPQNAVLTDGQWPKPGASGPIQVVMHENAADKYFINVGNKFRSGGLEIVVVGLWRARDVNSTYWFDSAETSYDDKIWIPLATYRERIAPLLPRPIFYNSWYLTFDANSLALDQSARYAHGLIRLDSEMRRLVAGITTDYTPLQALNTYQKRADSLTTLFYAVGGPMVVLALLFITLTASIAVQQYEQETATMRGRGTSWLQIVTLNLAESAVLIGISLPLSLLVGWLEAILMGHTQSFLKFTGASSLHFTLQGINLTWLLVGILIILVARFVPVLSLSHTTIVRMKQEHARGTRKPVWQRFYLDFLLLIPGVYAYLTMKGLAKPAQFLENASSTAQTSQSQYQDPLLFVAPALFAMALCMIALRLLPLLMRLLSTLVDRLPGVWAYLSLQQIARRPQDHSSALLLIMISLSLSIFYASTAKTLDRWTYDSLYYKSGADLAVHEYMVQSSGTPGSGSATTTTQQDLDVDSYVNLEEYRKLPGVENATRVGKYDGSFSYGVGDQKAAIMAIDRLDFPQVAFYRRDFAGMSLGALMNVLGASPNNVLIPQSVADKLGLRVGDNLNVSISLSGQAIEKEMTIAGTYTYFPTVLPDANPTLIANLDGLFETSEAAVGYDIWLKLARDVDTTRLVSQMSKMVDPQRGVVKITGSAYDDLNAAIQQPERKGLFGVLNVGFIATGLMPGIGFVLYSYASLRRRFIQLGILQAIGLSVKQLVGYLASEQFLLMGLAILLGAGIGLLTSNLFVPFLQVTGTSSAPVPPFEVLIGWGESAWLSLVFTLVLCATVVGTIGYLLRIKVFQAVKMGEAL